MRDAGVEALFGAVIAKDGHVAALRREVQRLELELDQLQTPNRQWRAERGERRPASQHVFYGSSLRASRRRDKREIKQPSGPGM